MRIQTDERSQPRPQILLPEYLRDDEIEHLADFIESLRRREAYCLGFIPGTAYPDAMRRGRLFIELENDEPCGFCLWARRKHQVKIHQTAVTEDCRRVKHGTSIVAQVLNANADAGARQLQLRVADDLPANAFWKSIGCKVATTIPGGKTWGRMIHVYRMDIRRKIDVAANLIDANLIAHHEEAERLRKGEALSPRRWTRKAALEAAALHQPPSQTDVSRGLPPH